MMRKVFLLATCLGLGTSAARAELPGNAVALLDAAYTDFQTLAVQTRTKGTMPRWSVPADRAVLQRMFDARALLGTAPYKAEDFAPTLKILDKELALLKDYLSFSPDATKADTDQNLLTFQDETSRISAMLIRIDAVYVPAITQFVAQLKPDVVATVKPGLKKLGAGILQELTGVSGMIASPTIDAENRAILVDAVTDSGGSIAAGVTPADRQAFAAKLETTLAALTPEEKTKIQGFLKAMASKDCIGLCALEE